MIHRRSILKTGALASLLAGVRPGKARAFVPAHNWDKYDFGAGPPVRDRLNQGPFPQYAPEEVLPASSVVMATTPSNEIVPGFGKGLITYISGDLGAPKVKGETLAETIEKLAQIPMGQKLFIRLTWREMQKQRGRLDFPEHLKLTLEMARKYNKRIAFRMELAQDQSGQHPALLSAISWRDRSDCARHRLPHSSLLRLELSKRRARRAGDWICQ